MLLRSKLFPLVTAYKNFCQLFWKKDTTAASTLLQFITAELIKAISISDEIPQAKGQG